MTTTNSQRPVRVGADIGGTFTDLVMLMSDGTYSVHKASTTIDDFSKGIADGLSSMLSGEGIDPARAVLSHR